jgi:phage terminase large subunit
VFTLRSGSRVEYVEVQSKKDTMEVAARAKVLSERLNATAVYVDVIGVGAGVVDKLKLDGVEVIAVNAAETAPNRSANKDDAQGRIMRDYLWIEMACWLREDEPAFLIDKDMAEDLAGELASVKYGIDGKGFLVVEMKDQMRKRLGRSPDLADSLALTFAPKLGFGILDYYRQMFEEREQAKADRADRVMDAADEAAMIGKD